MTALFSSEEPENKELISRINSFIGRPFFKSGKFCLAKESLVFYKDAGLVCVTSFSTLPNIKKTFISTPQDVFELDGSHEAITDINDKIGILLTKDTVLPYVAFFLSQLSTPDGKFKLVTNVDDIPFESEMDEETLRNLSVLIKKPVLEKDGDSFVVLACVLYATTLYKATIFVSKNGQVTLNDEQPLYTDLPISYIKMR